MSPSQKEDRFLELLAGQCLNDLSMAEQRELDELPPEEVAALAAEFDRTAAAVLVASPFDQPLESLPNALALKIKRAAAEYFVADGIVRTNVATPHSKAVAENQLLQPAIRRRELFAWLSAAAALLFAFGYGRLSKVASRLASVERNRLLADAADLIQLDWGPGKTPFSSPVSGDVVWSNALQTGFLRFVGMPVNNPTLEQYQLWIVDPSRDDEPIDGGVFDISSIGEVIIPIDAKLRVVSPAAFAITIEKPGGVVVSTQARLPLLAAVPPSKT